MLLKMLFVVSLESDWAFNKDLYTGYRIVLVMENSYTEKIVNAFLGGSVPIWYGTREIFKIFNRKAFVFYDPHTPQEALNRIAHLGANRTAYDKVLSEPILANGSQTVRDYFSFQDAVGGGVLKWKI